MDNRFYKDCAYHDTYEIFGPVMVVVPYEDFNDAIDAANDSIFGLHSACFTNDINLALKAADKLEAGGIIINETSATHVPNSPFGGIKNSGAGDKESPSQTIIEMSDEKTIVIAIKDAAPRKEGERFSKI